jgi:catechol 2,3-dioxygenase-like lactoylglutathione lyase family enzyme
MRRARLILSVCAAIWVPQGASAQPAAAPDPAAPAKSLPPELKPARIRATGITVSDLEKEKAFYVEVFGMQEIRRPNANEIVLGYKTGASEQATLVLAKGNRREGATAYGRMILDVANPEALAEHLKSLGYNVRKVGTPADRAFFVQDPEGYNIELYTPNPK